MAKTLTKAKAREILHDGTAHGKPLTDRQRRFFGAMSAQDGKLVNIDSTLNANLSKDFVQRMFEKNTPTMMLPGETEPSTHFMESGDGRVYPRVVRDKGKMKFLSSDEAWDYAKKTGEYIQFPNDEQAQWFGKHYKEGKGVLPKHQMGGGVKKAYNPKLAAKDVEFQDWFKHNTWEAKEGRSYSDKLAYDYYSFYKNGDYKNSEYNMNDDFPDTYKRPSHPTFSDESIYAIPENPGGHWGENGKYIPNMQMGGSLPGAGGFMYSRSGGVDTKKAQSGKKIEQNKQDRLANFKDLYKPVYDRVEPIRIKGQNTPVENSYIRNIAMDVNDDNSVGYLGGDLWEQDRAIPPLTSKLKKLQQKLIGSSDEEIQDLLGSSNPIEVLKNKPKNIGWLEGLDYYNHIDSLHKVGYTFKEGGVIEDDRGQWAHPGEVTKINSNQITMKGVPYPVLGVSDKGDKKMMYPGQDYSFDGSNVTEYPMAQDGKVTYPEVEWTDSFDPRKWGLKDYTQAENFNTAFKTARKLGDKEFLYKDKRYNTKLIPKEESDLYFDSKKFIEQHYTEHPPQVADYDRRGYIEDYSKKKYGQTLSEYYDEAANPPKGSTMAQKDKFWDDFSKRSDLLSDESLMQEPDFQEFLGKASSDSVKKYLNDKGYYFSITNQKPEDMHEDGSHDRGNKKIFIDTSHKEGSSLSTTPVHELTHKANSRNYGLFHGQTPKIDVGLINEMGGFNGDFEYLSNPSEIEARKLSTLYYLNKKKGKKEVTGEDISEMESSKDTPYDVKQLLNLYQWQKGDLLNYLNSKDAKTSNKPIRGNMNNGGVIGMSLSY